MAFAYDLQTLAATAEEHRLQLEAARQEDRLSGLDLAQSLANQARLAHCEGRLFLAQRFQEMAAVVTEVGDVLPGTSQARIWCDLGMYCLTVGQADQARHCHTRLRQGLQVAERQGQSFDVTAEQGELAVLLFSERGWQSRCLEHQCRLRRHYERTLGHRHPTSLRAVLIESSLRILVGDYVGAREEGLELIAACRDVFSSPALPVLLASLAVAWAEIGLDRFSAAAQRLEDALAESSEQGSWARTVISYAELVAAYAARNTPAAIALDIVEGALTSVRMPRFVPSDSFAELVAGSGWSYDEAHELAQEAFVGHPPDSPVRLTAERLYLEVLAADERLQEAFEKTTILVSTLLPESWSPDDIEFQWQIFVLELYVFLLSSVGRAEVASECIKVHELLHQLAAARIGEASVPALTEQVQLAEARLAFADLAKPGEVADTAVASLADALDVAERKFGATHPLILDIAGRLARVLFTLPGEPDSRALRIRAEQIRDRYRGTGSKPSWRGTTDQLVESDITWRLTAILEAATMGNETEEVRLVSELVQSAVMTFGPFGTYTSVVRHLMT